MERTTFGLLFYIRRDKTNKKGEAPVFMRLTINGERADASIKRFIEPHAWNSAKGKANEKSRGGKDLNLYLDAISANILQIQRGTIESRSICSTEMFLDIFRKQLKKINLTNIGKQMSIQRSFLFRNTVISTKYA